MINVENLYFKYGKNYILNDLTFSIKKSNIVSIIGPNGSGKSTLLACLTKYLKPEKGSIFLGEKDIKNISSNEMSRKVAIVSQCNNVYGNITVEQLVSYGRIPYKKWYQSKRENDYNVIKEVMHLTNVYKYRHKFISSLSGGERQRVWIAMALAQTPEVLFLDEPTTYLDISHQLELMKLIKFINKERGITVVMVLHDLNQAIQYSHKIMLMFKGGIFKYDIPEKVITSNTLKQVYNIDSHIVKDKLNKRITVTPIDVCFN